MIAVDLYSGIWRYSPENSQEAWINYENGLEKMILSVNVEKNENALWIFPVPADPNKVIVDIISTTPGIWGIEIKEGAKSRLSFLQFILSTTQIYPVPTLTIIKFIKRLFWPPDISDTSGIITLESGGTIEMMEFWEEPEVIIHKHLEKEGMTTEIITAKSAQALYQYLKDKNLNIDEGTIPALDHYIGKEFSFVISWISEIPQLSESTQSTEEIPWWPRILPSPWGERAPKGIQRGVFVTFPTSQIYYPLFLTSVYGDKTIPVEIRVLGHRSPLIFEDIKPYTNVEYFVGDYSTQRLKDEEELKNFYDGKKERIKYTKITIEAPSKFLTNDLWINPKAPIKTYYTSFFVFTTFWFVFFGIVFLILASIIASVLAGSIVFKNLRNKKGISKLALIGLSNCFSIIGLIIAVFLSTKLKPLDENTKLLLNKIKQRGYFWKRRLAIIIFIVFIPFMLIILLFLPVIILPGIISVVVEEFKNPSPDFRFLRDFVIFIWGLYLIPSLPLIFANRLRKIKKEDKPLFDQLKLAKYSSWLFVPREKLFFIFLFSIFFLVIEWLLIELIKLTL